MSRILLSFLWVCICISGMGQTSENEKLVELGKAYKDFMFRNEPPKDFIKTLRADPPANLVTATNFIAETITTDNDLLEQEFLELPDIQTLKFIYIIRSINYNL